MKIISHSECFPPLKLKRFPKSINAQNEQVEVCFSATLAKLSNSQSEAKQLQDAKILQTGIARLEKFSKDCPDNLSVIEFLGHLHHLRAIKLGNGARLAEALVEVQKAIAHNPYIEQAPETRNKLVQAMNQLQAQVQYIPDNAILNPKEKRLLAEADKGFAPMNAYMKSAAAKATIEAFNAAQAIGIWRSIGLPEPEVETNTGSPTLMSTESTTDWSRQALLLVDALNYIGNHPPQNPWDLAAAWEAVIAQKPELAKLDRGLIYAFLDRKLFRTIEAPVASQFPVPSLEPPLLTPTSTQRKWSTQLFIPRLFNFQDIQIKHQVIVATVLLVTAGGLTIHDTSVRSARDAAYQQILEAEQQQDYLKVVKEAEVFFANTPLSGKDGRNQQVMQLYSKALVRWVAQQEDQLNDNAQEHLKRYQAVMNSLNQGAN